MLSPIGNSYGYYTSSPYASGSTAAAARTALQSMNTDPSLEVQAVADVPEVFSNEETERVQRSPDELQQDRRSAYEIMNSLNIRNAEHLNTPLEFMANKPFEAALQQEPFAKQTSAAKKSGEPAKLTTARAFPFAKDAALGNSVSHNPKNTFRLQNNAYEAQLDAYSSFRINSGFHAIA